MRRSSMPPPPKISGAALVFPFLLLAFSLSALAGPIDERSRPTRAELTELAGHPTWLKLLRYDTRAKKSEVLSVDFFLAENGARDPVAELDATIEGYFAPWGADPDAHPRCKFPARYFWLSDHISLPGYTRRTERCGKLMRWALFDRVDSISALMVSGYFGNPASAFGHSLLRFNTASDMGESDLFDLTLNFGALVPPNENAILYVARGLLGGYQAGFSDRYFYTEDLVYARAEFRDIWEYRLELSEYERELLILHMWEIVGKKFTYYFLDKNCVYRIAEMIELATNEDFLDNANAWYFPVEFFHRLEKIDADRRASGARALIRSVKFIPSSQRELQSQLMTLRADELATFQRVITDGIDSLAANLAGFTTDQRAKILDALLAYQKYRLVGEEPDPTLERISAKNKILLARLRLPARPLETARVKELPSPADGSPPMAFGLGLGRGASGSFFTRARWSPYRQELVGQNSLEGSEFTLFDLAVGFGDGESSAFIDQLDLVRIRKLTSMRVKAPDEINWTWEARVGIDRIEADENSLQNDGIASFGAGRAWRLGEIVRAYALIGLEGHSRAPQARARPYLGIRVDMGRLKSWSYFGLATTDYKGNARSIWGGKIQYQPSKTISIDSELSNEIATRLSLGLSWYW